MDVKALLFIVLGAALVNAGCLGGALTRAADALANQMQAQFIVEGECVDVKSEFPVPMARAQAAAGHYLEPVPRDAGGAFATLVIIASACDVAGASTLPIPGPSHSFIEGIVVAAPTWDTQATVATMRLAVVKAFATHGGVASTFNSWGFPGGAADVNVHFESGPDPEYARAVTASAKWSGRDWRLHSSSGGPLAELPDSTFRLYGRTHQSPARAVDWYAAPSSGAPMAGSTLASTGDETAAPFQSAVDTHHAFGRVHVISPDIAGAIAFAGALIDQAESSDTGSDPRTDPPRSEDARIHAVASPASRRS